MTLGRTFHTGAVLLTAALLGGGCGIPGSEVLDGGDAPTGIAPGVTLYFLSSANDSLVAQFRDTERLGTVAAALDLLSRSTEPGPGLYSALAWGDSQPRPLVTEFDNRISIRVPVPRNALDDRGVAQLACTALGVHRQAGRPPAEVVIVPVLGPDVGPVGCSAFA